MSTRHGLVQNGVPTAQRDVSECNTFTLNSRGQSLDWRGDKEGVQVGGRVGGQIKNYVGFFLVSILVYGVFNKETSVL